MAKIILYHGEIVTLDEQDYEIFNKKCWHLSNYGYATHTINYGNNQYYKEYLHLEIARRIGLIGEIDHKDQNKLNNYRFNLRLATKSQNAMNQGISSKNTSGFKGVSWNKKLNKWIVQICIRGNHIYLGSYNDRIEAAMVYDRNAVRYFDEFIGYLNFPDRIEIYKDEIRRRIFP